jgi:hypothetical protein
MRKIENRNAEKLNPGIGASWERSPAFARTASIPHPIIRVLDKFALEFDEALLCLPPV